MGDRSAGEPRGIVRFHLNLPKQFACFRLNRVEPARHITEKQRVLAAERHRQNGGPHRPIRLKHPLQATRLGAHGVDQSAGASHEHLAINDRGRRERRHVSIEAKSPFQLETAHLIGT